MAVGLDMERSFGGKRAQRINEIEKRLQCRLTCTGDSVQNTLDLRVEPWESCTVDFAYLAFHAIATWTRTCVDGSSMDLPRYVL